MEPDNATFLRLLDYSVSVVYGAVSSLLVGLLVPDSWHILLGMIAGMLVAMAFLLPLAILLFIRLGGFQVLMSAMVIGMFNGMVIPMIHGVDLLTLLRFGIMFGIFIQFVLHMYDLKLHGEAEVADER